MNPRWHKQMSEEDRQSLRKYLGSLWYDMSATVAIARLLEIIRQDEQ